MALLDEQSFNFVIIHGKEAVAALKENNIEAFLSLAEKGWECFPEPRNNWNQGYNYAKMVFEGALKNGSYPEAKVWLNRMIDNNNNLHLFDYDLLHNIGKYYFETGKYDKAIENWEKVVKDAGFRYFENEKAEYLNFYKKAKKN
ncbi:hypothetical protein HQ47_04140 [Porphyromonas macacae]|uniref:Uncharacterized protein n=1 Tax=Porphyromonas macacae TaxID=28115 RepID=A0A0A2E887_9PORP|nr:tetratricopeptide repeat protein [Porphyromonas macacae]KGN75096.1 hypothetical protein HQ47_04140 [Porphyromonas macacae]